MVFSSPEFLFLFLPIVLIVYLLLDGRMKNGWLLLASLFFYAWGEGRLVLLMILSIGINYLGGQAIAKTQQSQRLWLTKVTLGVAISINLAFLAYYKYVNFFLDNLQGIGAFKGVRMEAIILPIGISFFTFQSISYLIDVYRKETEAQQNPFHLGLYIALFPQLIAGPIVRYHDIANQIENRHHSAKKFSEGALRFARGLAKKMVIANPMAMLADQAFNAPADELSTLSAWVGIVCYSLQIYFDFSGYSDMAIGLGKMFGFRFLENFQWPYISRSIQEFWRRWHISLSSWFRDYLYIPLGGNRKGAGRTYINLFIVFLATGLWHGANWTFVIWGLYHGLFIILERLGFRNTLNRMPRPISHLYLLLVVMVGWVFFRADSLSHATTYLGSMIGMGSGKYIDVLYYLDGYHIFILALGLIFSTNLRRTVIYLLLKQQRKLKGLSSKSFSFCYQVYRIGWMTFLMVWAITELAQNSYNPFIYFRF